MSFRISTAIDNYNKTKTNIFSTTKGKLDVEKDPVVQAIVKAQADMITNSEVTFQDSISQLFSQSATDEAFLKAIAFDSTRNEIKIKEATKSIGNVICLSSSTVVIPAGTLFITDDGELFVNLITRTCQNQSFFIQSITRLSNIVTVVIPEHNLPTNFTFTISGVAEVGFNGTFEFKVVDENTLTCDNIGIDESGTGTIIGSFLGTTLEIQSLNASIAVNKTLTSNIELASGINDVESTQITFNGILGGTDKESTISFQQRLIEFLNLPENRGNLFQHRSYIKQNTDSNFVFFFTSEDEINIYLTGVVSKVDSNFEFSNFSVNELSSIKGQFIQDNQLLLGVDALNLSFTNPSFVNIDLTITNLTPNTLEMQNSINLVLKEYLSLLPINYYLNPSHSELSSTKIESIIRLARDSSGNSANIDNVVVNGVSGLDDDIKKPVLGVVNYA